MRRPTVGEQSMKSVGRWRRRMLLRQEKRKGERRAKPAAQPEKLTRHQEAKPPAATPAADGSPTASQEGADPNPLIAAYQARGLNFPGWAYRQSRDGTTVPPSVPFIGHRYGRWGGILVYASAENHADYERDPEKEHPPYFADGRVWNRHRAAFDTDLGSGFFPSVHIAPFNDGSLLVAVHYYLMRVHGEEVSDPVDLTESIAAANFCKFSAAGGSKDYANNPEMIKASIPYVREDLRYLRPKVILLPRTIYRHRDLRLREMIEERAPGASVCPLYQFNPRNVQVHLKHFIKPAECLQQQLEGTRLEGWISQMRGYMLHSPYRYLIHMDEELGWPPYERLSVTRR